MARTEPARKVRPTKTDERLLIEAAQRDRARFADIYEEYFEIVYAYIARRVRNRSTAEDYMNGYGGRILTVDLSTGSSRIDTFDEQWLQIGAGGIQGSRQTGRTRPHDDDVMHHEI